MTISRYLPEKYTKTNVEEIFKDRFVSNQGEVKAQEPKDFNDRTE
jgi:hypothetical protein